MHIIHSLNAHTASPPPYGLTIGSFDGMHLGHQFLLKTLREQLGPKGTLAALTFSNHPADVIPGLKKAPLLCSFEYKLQLLEKAGVNLAIILEFTSSFSEKSYDVFLKEVFKCIPFSYLILGTGAAFGKNRQGDELHIKNLGKELHFEATYLDKKKVDDENCSSGLIRHYLQQGDIHKVASLLGRPYALYGKIKNHILDTTGLCLPPPGTYSILINNIPAKAHINDEVTIECKEILSECTIEAIFL
ncbi:MAG: FAD synthetase family protein [Chlamydiota bacterium]